MSGPTLVWFRQDLRLEDHPALHGAIARGQPVVPVYIWSPEGEEDWPMGSASKWWLHHSLTALSSQLERIGSRLIIRRGPALATLRALATECEAGAVMWNRRYEPASIARDTLIKAELRRAGLMVESENGGLLYEPCDIRNKAGTPFKVFTPFWKHCLSLGSPAAPLSAPKRVPAPRTWPASLPLDELRLLPRIPWDQGFSRLWQPGAEGARRELSRFLPQSLLQYSEQRDLPAVEATSRLSPHLHFGEISPRQVWQAALDRSDEQCIQQTASAPDEPSAGPYLRQLVWREFAHHLLYHFPHTPSQPLRTEFEQFPWREDAAALKAWQRGRTGYPIVDAGMRQLWSTGWMHNRVRMIVGSFLVKDLLISWRSGAAWFWDTLVDADLANNTLGWQWIGGCGADAAPYFRIFNPVLQGEKFDPRGAYVRAWVPELSRLPDEWIQHPWDAPAAVLRTAGVQLGRDYPHPLVDHKQSRTAALAALQEMNQRAKRV